MRAALVTVSPKVLADALSLPRGTEIRGVRFDGLDSVITIRVEHDDLKDVTLAEGELPPITTPQFFRIGDFVVGMETWGAQQRNDAGVNA